MGTPSNPNPKCTSLHARTQRSVQNAGHHGFAKGELRKNKRYSFWSRRGGASALLGILLSAMAWAQTLPPEPTDYRESDAGKMRISKKILKPGDTVEFSFTWEGVFNRPGFTCGWCRWWINGPARTDLRVGSTTPYLEIVDIQPAAQANRLVVEPSDPLGTKWTAIDPPIPPDTEEVWCNCPNGYDSEWRGVPNVEIFRFPSGTKFTMKCKVRDDAIPDFTWRTLLCDALFTGGSMAFNRFHRDYFVLGGEIGLEQVSVDPPLLSADGTAESTIQYRVFLKDSGRPLRNQGLHVTTTLGTLTNASAGESVGSDAGGIVTVRLRAGYETGVADVHASIPSGGPEVHTSIQIVPATYKIELTPEPKAIPAGGKAKTKIKAKVMLGANPASSHRITFSASQGNFYDRMASLVTGKDVLAKEVEVRTESNGTAEVQFYSSETTGTVKIKARFEDKDHDVQEEADVYCYKILLEGQDVEYWGIPGRSPSDPLKYTFRIPYVPSATLYGRTRMLLKARLSGAPVDGVKINLTTVEGWWSGGFGHPKQLVTDAQGIARFNFDVGPFPGQENMGRKWQALSQVTLVATPEDFKEYSEKAEYLINDNYGALVSLYAKTVPKGPILDAVANPADHLIAGEYLAKLAPVVGLFCPWQGLLTDAFSFFGLTEFDRFTCGNYQIQILCFLDTLRLDPLRARLLNGIDYGPIMQGGWPHEALGHLAVMLWPQAAPDESYAVRIFDPWAYQDPARGEMSLEHWLAFETTMQSALPIISQLFAFTTRPGSDVDIINQYYPCTGNPYPTTACPGLTEWSWQTQMYNKIQVLYVDCPVRFTVTDGQGNQTGYLENPAAGVPDYTGQIPQVRVVSQYRPDGTMTRGILLTDQVYTLQLNAYGDGHFSFYQLSNQPGGRIFSEVPIATGDQVTLHLGPGTPPGDPAEFGDGSKVYPDSTPAAPTATPPVPTATPTPTQTPVPTSTPAPRAREVRVVLGYQAPADLEDILLSVLEPLGVTADVLREKAPGQGTAIELWQLAGSGVILYTNGGRMGRRVETLNALLQARQAGIPLLLIDNDLAWSQNPTNPPLREALVELTRLTWTADTGLQQVSTITPENPAHPLWTGLGTLRCGADLDRTRASGTGVEILARDQQNQPVVFTYQAAAPAGRVLVSLPDYEKDPDFSPRFVQNAILWLLGRPIPAPSLDLVISSPQIPSEGVPGEILFVQYHAEWSGPIPETGSWKDAIDLVSSGPPEIRMPVGSATWNINLIQENSYDASTTITLPWIPEGSYSLIIRADAADVLAESNKANNELDGGMIQVRQPNLQASNLRGTPSEAWPGMNLDVLWTVANIGNGVARAPWTDELVIVEDAVSTHTYPVGYRGRTDPLPSGQSYDAHITASFPNLPEGDYHLEGMADRYYNLRETLESDNAVVSSSFRVIHCDLAVEDGETSPVGAPGQPVLVTWKAHNTGAVPAAGGWRQVFSLSRDDQWGNDQLLGGFVQPDTIAPDGVLNQELLVGLPPDLPPGTYWIGLELNPDQTPLETSLANNRMLLGPVHVGLPDLSVALNSSVPSQLAMGGPLFVQWTVVNEGPGPASILWRDRLALVPDGGGDEIPLVESDRSTPLPLPGDSYEASTTITLPSAVNGSYRLRMVTDGWNSVPETNESNNHQESTAFLLTGPDLVFVAGSGSVSSTEVMPRQPVQVQYRVENANAIAAPGPWHDFLYLSADPVYGSGDIYAGSWNQPAGLAGQGSYTATVTFNVPEIPDGDYWVILVLDRYAELAECREDNNESPLLRIHLRRPNLVAEALRAPNALDPGETSSASWTVRNAGPRPALGLWKDSLYLVDLLAPAATPALLKTLDRPRDLPPGGLYELATSFTLPYASPSSFTLLVRTDDARVLPELLTADNVTTLGLLTLRYPNLITRQLQLPMTLVAGSTVQGEWILANQGTGAARKSWYDVLYISTQPEPGKDRSLQTLSQPAILAAGDQRRTALTYSIPSYLGEGTFWYAAVTDTQNSVMEQNESDNRTVLGPVEIHFSSLALASVTAPTTHTVGLNIPATLRVENISDYPFTYNTGTSFDVWLSQDEVQDEGDYQFFTWGVTFPQNGILAPGAELSWVINLYNPPGTAVGDYYLIVQMDPWNSLADKDRTDNRAVSNRFTLDAADLVTSGVLQVPLSAVLGDSFPVQWEVWNLGGFAAGPAWWDRVILSNNTNLDYKDTVVYSQERLTPLPVGHHYSLRTQVTIPSVPAGSYFLFIVADPSSVPPYSRVFERDENNNHILAGPISITGPDLVCESMVVDPEAWKQEQVKVSWTVRNAGTAPAGSTWRDSVFIFPSGATSQDDLILLGTIPGSVLEVGDPPLQRSAQYSIPAIPNGQYRIVVYTDYDQWQTETNETNNYGMTGPYSLLRPAPNGWLAE